jgi:hypothetical protein
MCPEIISYEREYEVVAGSRGRAGHSMVRNLLKGNEERLEAPDSTGLLCAPQNDGDPDVA